MPNPTSANNRQTDELISRELEARSNYMRYYQ